MCLIVLAWEASPGTRLAVAANRDEFFARPAAPAAWWSDAPDVLAGRDLEGGGTWLGVTRTGRFAALTNFRDATVPRKDGAPSRGALTADFLRGRASAAEYVAAIRRSASLYHGFNLLVSDGAELWSFSNMEGDPERLGPGVRGLSNHLLETPWPKVTAARSRLEKALAAANDAESLERRLLDLLEDRTVAPDDALPATGLSPEWERALSAAFVELPGYGTRASTALVFDANGMARFAERSFGPGGARLGEVREVFRVMDDSRILLDVASSDSHFEQILSLQRQNLFRVLSDEQQEREGFVFAEYTAPLLARMAAELPQAVALVDGRVVGYSLALPVSLRAEMPSLAPMFRQFDEARYRGRPLPDCSFMVGGQVCVEKAFRGQGLLQRLYHETRRRLPPGYELCVTEIATRNKVSVRAHEKMGFEAIARYSDGKEDWTIVAWDLRDATPAIPIAPPNRRAVR